MSNSPNTSVTWSELQPLLQHALGLPPHERLQWIDQAPEIREEFRETLRRLLEIQAGVDSKPFLTDPPFVNAGVSPSASAALIGDRVGPYQLLQELGDGGMGSVWLADRVDGALKRKVALKLPRLAWVRGLADRMAMERDILSALEHPNIARLYDAGVDQLGRPYLALEYVEGERLDRYCDSNRLTIRDRVQLFLQVLDAVQYAHVNLVLHRDIKPGNILVNRRGEVRLLDFGIAKLVDDDPTPSERERQTRTSSRAMTPRYASPEQLKQVRLTLTSDIYSLGVVLFELLVGMTPLITADDSRAELERAIVDANIRTASRTKITPDIAERRQSTPSRISRILRGDIDAIIHRAMSSRSLDRYISAEAFRADLIRWLDGRPVEATPPSRLIALGKFVRRNRLAVSLGAAAVITIISIATVALIQAQEARLESRRATATRDFLLTIFDSTNSELNGGRELTAREMLQAGEKKAMEVLESQPDIYSEVLAGFADAWGRLGEYELMNTVAHQRSVMLRKAGDRDLYISALIDEAQIYVSRDDVNKVKDIVKEISLVSNGRLSSADESADLLWLKGWIVTKSGDCKKARTFFETAKKTIDSRDFNRASRAEFGILICQLRTGSREKALESYRNAIGLTKRIEEQPGDRLRRSFEIVAAIFDAGEYAIGWEDMNSVFIDSVKLYSLIGPYQKQIFNYWISWALRVEQANYVIEWLENNPKYLSRVAIGNSGATFEWNIFLAKAAMAAEDPFKSDQIIKSIDRKALSVDEKLALDLLNAENSIKTGRADIALDVLDAKEWIAIERGVSTVSQDWLVYRDWVRGVALERLGFDSRAAVMLSSAVSLAEARIGAQHPITAQIRLARLLVSLKIDGSISGRRSALAAAEKDKQILVQSYAARSPSAQAANSLVQSLKFEDQSDWNLVVTTLRESAAFL